MLPFELLFIVLSGVSSWRTGTTNLNVLFLADVCAMLLFDVKYSLGSVSLEDLACE